MYQTLIVSSQPPRPQDKEEQTTQYYTARTLIAPQLQDNFLQWCDFDNVSSALPVLVKDIIWDSEAKLITGNKAQLGLRALAEAEIGCALLVQTHIPADSDIVLSLQSEGCGVCVSDSV